MPWCAARDDGTCKRPDDYIGTPVHDFSGYGWWVVFHPECCPGQMDGSLCMSGHPEGWQPSDPEGVEAVLADMTPEKRRVAEADLYEP